MREFLSKSTESLKDEKGPDMYKRIKMRGPTLAFENGISAIQYGLDSNSNTKTVLFVMCMQNYSEFKGFRLGHQNYSPNYEEGMTILAEGTEFSVLDIETH